jgi:hypothetical protein
MQSPSQSLRRAIGVNLEGLAFASPFCFKSKQVKLYIIFSVCHCEPAERSNLPYQLWDCFVGKEPLLAMTEMESHASL